MRTQACLAPNNNERLHASTIFSLPSVTCRALVTILFFFSPSFSLTPPSLPLKLMKRNDQNARRQMESLCFGVLICETGRCYTKNKWWQFHCSSLYHYHPLSTFSFQSSHMCRVSLLCTWYRTQKGKKKKKKEFVSRDMIYACRKFKLRAQLR